MYKDEMDLNQDLTLLMIFMVFVKMSLKIQNIESHSFKK